MCIIMCCISQGPSLPSLLLSVAKQIGIDMFMWFDMPPVHLSKQRSFCTFLLGLFPLLPSILEVVMKSVQSFGKVDTGYYTMTSIGQIPSNYTMTSGGQIPSNIVYVDWEECKSCYQHLVASST